MNYQNLPQATSIRGDEQLVLIRNGVAYRASFADIRKAEPGADGIYPDHPINYIEMVRSVGQESPTVVLSGNPDILNRIMAMCFPCTIDRNSLVTQLLNGRDVTQTVDGRPANITDPEQPCMVRIGGIYKRYFYDAETDTKHIRYSVYPIRGYKYVRRRYLSMYNGHVTTASSDGKTIMTSVSDVFCTYDMNIEQYHSYAKNLGIHFRAQASQDRNLYAHLFFMVKKTYDCQSVYNGLDLGWSTFWNFDRTNDGGQANCGQLYKTGVLNGLKSHEGQSTVEATDDNGVVINAKPNKWLWREDQLNGPYWIRETGYVKENNVWYEANDINTIANFTPVASPDEWTALLENPITKEGYISEMFEDTNLPIAVEGSSSKGYCDKFSNDTTSDRRIPLSLGGAGLGSARGLSCLHSFIAPSNSHPNHGAALASDDPTDSTPDKTEIV